MDGSSQPLAEITNPPVHFKHYRDELNFAEFPLAAINDTTKGKKTLVFGDVVFDRGQDKPVTRRLTITASDEYGLPTPLDEEVLVGLIQLTCKQGFTDRKIYFTRYELIKLLDWRLEGQSYQRITESLKRWLGVTLFYNKAWWCKEAQSWVDENFHILENVTIFDNERRAKKPARSEDSNAGMSSFVWNEAVFGSFQAGYIKQLDFELFKRLKSAISKRMFRFLDKRFYHKEKLELDLRVFACEHVGLSKNYHIGGIKRRLKVAIEELEEVGFLEKLSLKERFIRQQRGEWLIVLIKKAKQGRGGDDTQLCPVGINVGLVERLVTVGISKPVAISIVGEFSQERIEEKLKFFDWLVAKKDVRIGRNPAGYLVSAIKGDYAIPKEIAVAAQHEEEKKRAIARKIEADAKANAIAEAKRVREQKERDELDRYWNALSEDEQQRFEEEALKEAPRFHLGNYRAGKGTQSLLFKTTRQLIIDAHIKRIQGMKKAA